MAYRKRLAAAFLILSLGGGPASALACGYHDPSAFARGALNWLYPDSLHVPTAEWQAEDAGLLPPRKARKERELFEFHRIAADMKSLGRNLSSVAPPDAAELGLSVVLLNSVMWTRYATGAGGFTTEVHADGPGENDVVAVTTPKVVRALLDGVITFSSAETHGLLRLYGAAEGQQATRARFLELEKTMPGAPGQRASNNQAIAEITGNR
jgi:hypothetical protein